MYGRERVEMGEGLALGQSLLGGGGGGCACLGRRTRLAPDRLQRQDRVRPPCSPPCVGAKGGPLAMPHRGCARLRPPAGQGVLHCVVLMDWGLHPPAPAGPPSPALWARSP